jgi:hypothetical protein
VSRWLGRGRGAVPARLLEGAGTYTGIEAVSNGLQLMREPKVETGKRTMAHGALRLR